MNPRGLPRSEIPGSKLVCSSPGLIAAYRVLHRLLAPRHSPYALSSLTTSVSNSRDDRQSLAAITSARSLLTLRPRTLLHVLRTIVRKELPFAGYSVVKEPPSRSRAPAWQCPRI